MNETRSLKRALSILDLYSLDNYELGVTQVSEQLSLSKGTVSRLMRTLEAENILRKNALTRKYCLTGKVLRFSNVYLSRVDLKTVADPYLKELSQKTNELILLHVVKGDRRMCLDWIESTNIIRHVILEEHKYAPLHAGSPGKLLLAFLPDRRIDEIIRKTGLPRYTDITITHPQILKEEIRKIRETETALSFGEHVPHSNTVSVPIKDWKCQVVAALSISWLAIGDTHNHEAKYTPVLKDAAARLSQELGYPANGFKLTE